MKKRLTFLLIAILGTTILATACAGKPEGALAKVNGEYITQVDVDTAYQTYLDQLINAYGATMFDETTESGQAIRQQIKDSMLDVLINEKVINNLVKENGLSVTDADIQAELDMIKTNVGGEEAYQQQLAAAKITETELIENIRRNLPYTKYHDWFLKNNPVTDEDALAALTADKELSPQLRASHILVASKEEAQAVLDRINAGEDFATVAKAVSTDTGTKDNGGDVGYFIEGYMVDSFFNAAKSLEVGKVSDVVQSDFGYHVIKLTEKETDIGKYQENIRSAMIADRKSALEQEKFQAHFEEAKKKQKVEIYTAKDNNASEQQTTQ